jgi:hypothetical protein
VNAQGAQQSSRLGNRHLAGGAAAACAVCCAAPLVGFLGVAGLAATAVTLAFAGVVFAVIVGMAALAATWVRRSRPPRVSCVQPPSAAAASVELGPTRRADA